MTEFNLPPLLADKMRATLQNPRYHAEGDVYSHTQMVLERFNALRPEFNLSKSDEAILFWAAILHDIGKTETTQKISGIWRSPGHEMAGVPIARNILLANSEISAQERHTILDLVRWHYYPFWWMRKSKDENELKLFSTRVDLRLLSIFSIMDISGRVSTDLEESVALTRKFQSEFASKIEYEWGTYPELQTRFSNWSHKLKNAAWSAYRLKNASFIERLFSQEISPDNPALTKKVTLMIGPALSGKSHFVAHNYPGAFVVNLDDFLIGDHFEADAFALDRRVTEFGYLLSIYSNHHPEVFVEGRVLNPVILEKLNRVIRSQNVKLKYLFFESKLEDLFNRSRKMPEALNDSFIQSHYKMQISPHPWEAHEIEWVES